MSPTPPIPCLIGPTASGKTGVGIELARAARGEVICCDAYSVYAGMRVLTAAPDAPADVPHHLVGGRDPAVPYSAACFAEDADGLVDEIRSRGRTPWIVGGTALYLRGWLKGFGAPVARDEGLRQELRALADTKGPEAVHALLVAEDAARAKDLHPNDLRRVVRALEITRITGRPASTQRDEWSGPDRVAASVVCLVRGKDDLERRIRARTEAMFAAGVALEARRLLERPICPEAAKVLGLTELKALLAGDMDAAQAKDQIALRTRQFARKQMTFFRSFKDAQFIEVAADASDCDVAAQVANLLP